MADPAIPAINVKTGRSLTLPCSGKKGRKRNNHVIIYSWRSHHATGRVPAESEKHRSGVCLSVFPLLH